MALEYITVKGTFLGPDGLPEVGYVEFRPNVPLTLSTGGILIPEPIRANLDSKGYFITSLLATNCLDVFPYGWYWVVDEKVEHGNLWYLMTNTPAGGGRDPLDISNAYRPIGPSDQVPIVVQPGPAGVKGDQGTVSVDSTETGEPGTEALVIDLDPANTGAVLKFIIPRGEQGIPGPPGTVSGVGIPEIYAQPNEPAALAANVLWVDIDDNAGTGGVGGSVAEIYTQPTPPGPTGNNILWVDTDDVTTITPSDHLVPAEILAGTNVTVDRTATTVTINATGGGGGGGLQTRATATKTTASLAANASESGTITLANGYRLLNITTSAPARVRLYTTTAKRDADASRPIGTDPSGDHGLVFEFVSIVGLLAADLSPTVDGFDGKTTPDGIIPVSITNTGTNSAAITAILVWIRTE